MSTATLSRRRLRPRSRLFTVAEVAMLPERLGNSDVKYELYRGELVIMAPPGGEHARRQHMIGRVLQRAEDLGLGVAYSEVGVILHLDPDTLYGPDAAFVLKASLPVKYTREGYIDTLPEIIVEVKSKNDTDPKFRSKCADYLEAGVKVVWWIDPYKKTLLSVSADGREQSFGVADTLICDLLPGFTVPLAMLFD